ncbi:MAG: formylmethanofuran--tetrahydromethanopterin N-formyltransferase [Planctomycetaceae bacterium]|nr:formylmethanofuran--tetrahydromethanopterin N-formyltransferase [Planctomycetaceae bacterium]
MAPDVKIENTYAEAFRSIYAEVLITAKDRFWLEQAVNACTGHASSTIMCDCEAGLDHYLEPEETPDGRIGAVVQFHIPRFIKKRERALEKVLIARLSQNVLTCPTAKVFNHLNSETNFSIGKKIAYFGDGHQFQDTRDNQPVWVIPIMGGEFILSRKFGYSDGIMGGNLWFMGHTQTSAIDAAYTAACAAATTAGVITTFPGGVAASASKAGSQYSFLFASTYEKFCPTLRDKLGDQSGVPDGVTSIMEIIINGHDLETVSQATYNALEATRHLAGLEMITAGNYGGRLGKSFIYLRPELQASSDAA